MFENKKILEPLDFENFSPERLEAIRSLGECSFAGREALLCGDVWYEMLCEKELVIWLGIAGAPVPSGLGRLFAYLARNRLVDVIVSVGSQCFHDLHWALGQGYWRHDPNRGDFRDFSLKDACANRYHNVISSDLLERETGYWAREIWRSRLCEGARYSSAELLDVLAVAMLSRKNHKRGSSFVAEAWSAGVPVFAPTLHDSWLGCELVDLRQGIRGRIENGNVIREKCEPFFVVYDALKDVEDAALITKTAKSMGIISFGGGVPRNFIQQTAFLYNLSDASGGEKNFDYAIKFSGDKPSLGGLSGSSLSECVAWGKYNKNAKLASADGDATLNFPIAVAGLLLKLKKTKNFSR